MSCLQLLECHKLKCFLEHGISSVLRTLRFFSVMASGSTMDVVPTLTPKMPYDHNKALVHVVATAHQLVPHSL